MPEEELGSTTKGKQAELQVFGELLKRGHQIYTPMTDVAGIDCLVDVGEGNYKEIQVKSSHRDSPLFQVRKFKPRDSFYIVCCLGLGSEGKEWVIPSKVFNELGTATKVRGKDYIRLTIGKEGSESYERVAQYIDGYRQLLRGATKEVREVVQRTSKRIEGPHLKQRDYMYEILEILTSSEKPMTRKEIVTKAYGHLNSRFSEADFQHVKTGGVRWKDTAEWAISTLKSRDLIDTRGKNQYVITDAGRTFLKEWNWERAEL